MTGRSAPLRSPKRCYLLPNRLPFKRHSSNLSHLQEEMTSRRLPIVRDILTLTPSSLLQRTLTDFLPFIRINAKPSYLPYGYHLIHFPTNVRLSTLLPDGTDAMQSPGDPFTRRMWAGGSIIFERAIKLDNSAFHCIEHIVDVHVKGHENDQKIFVKIERKIYPGKYPGDRKKQGENIIPHLVETRTLVFMREDRQKAAADATPSPSKALMPTHTPDFSHTLVPTAALLFRFSALTFNAHAIHLDKQYCRDFEGHRNLLVHGPLSLVLMLQFLDEHLRKAGGKSGREEINSVEYRNLAPLYAEEEMKVCIKRKKKGEISGSWDVWIEGRDGGYAVKGTVRTTMMSIGARPSELRNIIWNGAKEGASRSPKGNTIPEMKSASVDEISTGDETIPENEAAPTENSASEAEMAPNEEAPEDNTPYFQR